MDAEESQSSKRNWNVTGRELSPWRLILLVFPPPIGLVVDDVFGPVAAISAGVLLYAGIIWFVVTVPKKDREIQRDEPEESSGPAPPHQ